MRLEAASYLAAFAQRHLMYCQSLNQRKRGGRLVWNWIGFGNLSRLRFPENYSQKSLTGLDHFLRRFSSLH